MPPVDAESMNERAARIAAEIRVLASEIEQLIPEEELRSSCAPKNHAELLRFTLTMLRWHVEHDVGPAQLAAPLLPPASASAVSRLN